MKISEEDKDTIIRKVLTITTGMVAPRFTEEFRKGYVAGVDHIFAILVMLFGEQDKHYEMYQEFSRLLEEYSKD